MTVVIIEDEQPAAERLEKLIHSVDKDINVAGKCDSISSAVHWFKTNPAPDLALMDIQLGDGSSFDIFQEISVPCPVIFTTAYDEYAVQAFKVNSIDYLLKPVKKEELESALKKFETRKSSFNGPEISQLTNFLREQQGGSAKRIVVHYGQNVRAVDLEDIAYFYTEDKINFLVTREGNRYSIDSNLEKLESWLPSKQFFRINRQFIVNIKSIDKMIAYSKSRIKLTLNPPTPHETITSTERSPYFKKWLAGE